MSKPDEIKELEGNPGRRPLKRNYPKAKGAPKFFKLFTGRSAREKRLHKYYREHWDRTCYQLERIGTLYETDIDALIQYCTAWATWIEANSDVAKNGACKLLISEKGNEYFQHNPYVHVAAYEWKKIIHYEKAFGLSPAARSRIDIQKKGDDAKGDFS